MKITCVQYLYTFYGVLGKREKYTQKNSSVALRHRDMIIVDRHVLDSTTVTLCYLYLPVFYVYLPVLSCVHEKRAALFTPQSCVWGGKVTLTPLSNLSLRNLMTLCFFKPASKEIRWSHIVKGNHGNR